ncbi:hypothetical protein Hdeb2414_s0004g00141681 [Helianthus debilis subsp. tardiflorus]
MRGSISSTTQQLGSSSPSLEFGLRFELFGSDSSSGLATQSVPARIWFGLCLFKFRFKFHSVLLWVTA